MKRYKPIFYYLALANFLFFLGNSLYILFPVFLKNLGASESYIGIMNNVDKVFIIIGSVSIASIMQGRDRIRMLRLGYLILLVAYASYLLISSLTWLVLAIRIIHGIGFSVAMILGTTIVFDIVPLEDAAEAIGVYGITGALSNAISPFVGEMLLARGYSHHFIFLLSVCLVGLSLGITFLLPRGDLHDPNACEPPTRGSLRLLAEPKYLLMTLAGLIFGGGFGVIVTYLPNFIRTTTDFRFSIFFMTYIAVLVVIRFTFMRIVNRFNRVTLIMIAFAAGALMNLCLNALYSVAVLLAVSVMYGITHGILYPVLNATMVGLVDQCDRGKANALFTATFNGGMMIFALSLGFLIDHTGTYLSAFNFCAVAFVAALPLLWIVRSRYGGLEVPRNGGPSGK
jgi:predicted MFS family arabinose efflux permease